MLLKESKTKVIAFEPMSESFKKLEEVKLDFKDRLENYNFAIGNENTSKKIFYENEDSEKASLIENLDELSFINNTKKNTKIVDVKKLDSLENLFKNKLIDFIKIDTEGYEFEVLMGAKNILNKHQPKYIQIEFNWHQLIRNQTLYKLSSLISFSDVFRILPHDNGLIYTNPIRPENNIYHLSNYVFIRKDISIDINEKNKNNYCNVSIIRKRWSDDEPDKFYQYLWKKNINIYLISNINIKKSKKFFKNIKIINFFDFFKNRYLKRISTSIFSIFALIRLFNSINLKDTVIFLFKVIFYQL